MLPHVLSRHASSERNLCSRFIRGRRALPTGAKAVLHPATASKRNASLSLRVDCALNGGGKEAFSVYTVRRVNYCWCWFVIDRRCRRRCIISRRQCRTTVQWRPTDLPRWSATPPIHTDSNMNRFSIIYYFVVLKLYFSFLQFLIYFTLFHLLI